MRWELSNAAQIIEAYNDGANGQTFKKVAEQFKITVDQARGVVRRHREAEAKRNQPAIPRNPRPSVTELQVAAEERRHRASDREYLSELVAAGGFAVATPNGWYWPAKGERAPA